MCFLKKIEYFNQNCTTNCSITLWGFHSSFSFGSYKVNPLYKFICIVEFDECAAADVQKLSGRHRRSTTANNFGSKRQKRALKPGEFSVACSFKVWHKVLLILTYGEHITCFYYNCLLTLTQVPYPNTDDRLKKPLKLAH